MATQVPSLRTRPRYLPISEAEPGMVLGAPLDALEHGFLSVSLPEGHTPTEENMQQLRARRAEFILCWTSMTTTCSPETKSLNAALGCRVSPTL